MITSSRRRRSFMSELLIWMLLLVVLPLAGIGLYVYQHMTAELKSIEKEKSLLANQAAENSIHKLGDSILGVTITNAYWEANRQALLKRDMEWLNTNITDMPSVVPNVDFVAEADLNGHVVVQAGDVEELKDDIRLPVVLERIKKEPSFSGIVQTSKGAAVIAAAIVTGDSGDGETAGMLLTGRFLVDEDMQSLSETLQTDIALVLRSGQQLVSSSDLLEEADLLQADRTEPFFSLSRNNGIKSTAGSPFEDIAGASLGMIYTRGSAEATTRAVDGLRNVGGYSLGIMLLLFIGVLYLLRRRVVLPLRHFTNTLTEVAAGREINDIPKHVQQAEAEILSAIGEIMQWNQTLERTVRMRTAAIRTLLDNAKQGFLSVGPDLLVRDEYSLESIRLLGTEPGGKPLPQLLYPGQVQEQELLRSILLNYFQEKDEWKRELIFSLLPDTLELGGIPVEIGYKAIGSAEQESGQTESIMLMLTDLSEKRRLESQMNQEREVLKMVVRVVTHQDDYQELLLDFERFYGSDRFTVMTGDASRQEKLQQLLRAVHTLKGSFGMLQFIHMVPALHELESALSVIRESGIDESDPLAVIDQAGLPERLEADIALLRDTLGDAYAEPDREPAVEIRRSAWLALERKIEARLSSEEDRRLLSELRQWRYQPFRSLVAQYPDYLMKLADRLGLLLHPVEVKGGEMLVDVEYYRTFARTLVHVIRNCVVHGIETGDDRLAAGKEAHGMVELSVTQSEQGLELVIADDGRGVSLEALKQAAAAKELMADGEPVSEVDVSPEAMLERLLFMDGLSTSTDVTELGGRGVGLAAVKAEVEKLGGCVRVYTTEGQGTSFVFQLPFYGIGGDEVESGAIGGTAFL